MTEYDARPPLRLVAALMAACLLTLALSSCGLLPDDAGADNGADDSQGADVEDAMLEFAQCMREHGVPMEDPKPGQRGLVRQGQGVDPEVARAAEDACNPILDEAMPEDGAREIPAEQKEALLAAAQCMRERGWDVPDPQFDGGRVTQRVGPGSDLDPEDPAFQQDMEECAEESGVQPPGERQES